MTEEASSEVERVEDQSLPGRLGSTEGGVS